MPSRIVTFFHHSVVTGAKTLTAGFTASNHHAHDLRAGATSGVAASRFRERVEGIHVRLSTVGSGTKITVKVTLDAAGNDIVVPDTEATIATGVSDATKGAVAYSVKLPIYQAASGEVGKRYVCMKADTVSPTAPVVDQTTVTWTET